MDSPADTPGKRQADPEAVLHDARAFFQVSTAFPPLRPLQ